jgi:hypothetical protein
MHLTSRLSPLRITQLKLKGPKRTNHTYAINYFKQFCDHYGEGGALRQYNFRLIALGKGR